MAHFVMVFINVADQVFAFDVLFLLGKVILHKLGQGLWLICSGNLSFDLFRF